MPTPSPLLRADKIAAVIEAMAWIESTVITLPLLHLCIITARTEREIEEEIRLTARMSIMAVEAADSMSHRRLRTATAVAAIETTAGSPEVTVIFDPNTENQCR
jgi:hypothetical protein